MPRPGTAITRTSAAMAAAVLPAQLRHRPAAWAGRGKLFRSPAGPHDGPLSSQAADRDDFPGRPMIGPTIPVSEPSFDHEPGRLDHFCEFFLRRVSDLRGCRKGPARREDPVAVLVGQNVRVVVV